MTDEAYCSVVLALLQVAFLGKCDDKGLGSWGWPVSCLPNLVADTDKQTDRQTNRQTDRQILARQIVRHCAHIPHGSDDVT